MKIEIHISTDGAAFEENGAAVEVARIVREIAWDVENMGESFGTTKYRLLFDVNGNACGHIDYIGKP